MDPNQYPEKQNLIDRMNLGKRFIRLPIQYEEINNQPENVARCRLIRIAGALRVDETKKYDRKHQKNHAKIK